MKLVIVIFMYLLTVGCSDGKPSESFLKKIYKAVNLKKSDKFIEILSFEKTNGSEFEIFGKKGYRAKYKAKIKYKRDCWRSSGFFGSFRCRDKKPKNTGGWFSNMSSFYLVKAGRIEDVSGAITFEMTDKGWEAPNGEIY